MKDNQQITALIAAQVEKLARQFGYDFYLKNKGIKRFVKFFSEMKTDLFWQRRLVFIYI